MAVRVVSIIAGVWLFLSAFLWPHHGRVALTTWIPGLLIAAVAAVAVAVPRIRYVNVILGAWVLAAAVASGADDLVMNNGLVGMSVITAAVLPQVRYRRAKASRRGADAVHVNLGARQGERHVGGGAPRSGGERAARAPN